MKNLLLAAAAACFLAFAGAASAANDPTLSGGATLSGGVVTLVSNTGDATATNDASSATWTLPANTTFAQLQVLGVAFDTTDDGCAAGSPRVTLHLAGGKNVFVYLGQPGNMNLCALNTWIWSGNLIGNNDVGRYDTSQVQPGTQVSTYAAALQLLGNQVVTSVSVDVDAGYAFADKEQTVLLKAFTVNGIRFPGEAQKPSSNPAMLCKAQRDADPAGFRAHWGTNHNKANAFGKCVSSMAHAVAMGNAAKVQAKLVAALKGKSASKHGRSDARAERSHGQHGKKHG